jgi:hypothetical protein
MSEAQETYLVKFVLGDWSNDGHGRYDETVVKSTKPVEYLRELHFKCIEELGIDPGKWAKEYENNFIPDDQIEALVKAGIDVGFIDYSLYRHEEGEYEGQYAVEDPKGIVNLWLDCLNLIDKDVDFQVIKDTIPTMHFYGFDSKKRHLNTPGYGLFFG